MELRIINYYHLNFCDDTIIYASLITQRGRRKILGTNNIPWLEGVMSTGFADTIRENLLYKNLITNLNLSKKKLQIIETNSWINRQTVMRNMRNCFSILRIFETDHACYALRFFGLSTLPMKYALTIQWIETLKKKRVKDLITS